MSKIKIDELTAIISENLYNVRKFEGENQNAIANKIKTTQASYSLSESGVRELSLVNLYYLAVEYGVNLNWLVGLSDVRFDKTTRVHHKKNLALIARRNKKNEKGGISGGNDNEKDKNELI